MYTDTIDLRTIKRLQKRDRQRVFRVVEYLDYSSVFEHSPVEITEGYIISDTDSYEVFASFVFRNVSQKGIKSLDVRLHLYLGQNIPYIKIPFRYSFESYTLGIRKKNGELIRDKKLLKYPIIGTSESFGETVYIPIPESYFTRMELEIKGVTYSDGSYEALELITGKTAVNFRELKDQMKYVYSKVNIYTYAEEKYPVKNLPLKGELAWMCCCGHKNPNNNDKCEHCLRERDWQFQHIAEEKLEETVNDLLEKEKVFFKPDKSNYAQTKHLETEDEINRKVKAYELAMKAVAECERKKENLKKWFIPRLLLCIIVIL